MCGITIIVDKTGDVEPVEKLKTLIENRGPDCVGSCCKSVPHSDWTVTAIGSTLWTQGDSPTNQPLTTDRGSFLLWNGDAYDYSVPSKQCDSLSILRDIEEDQEPLKVLSTVNGPYAFFYYNPETRSLWFGRDPIGRCSLVIHSSKDCLIISSVIPRDLDCSEVPSYGIFQLVFSGDSYDAHFHPWHDIAQDVSRCLPFKFSIEEAIQHRVLDRRKGQTNSDPDLHEVYSHCDNNALPPLELLTSLFRSDNVQSTIETVLKLLEDSVRRRVLTKPERCLDCSTVRSGCRHSKVAVLFSGGLDCTVLALLTHRFVNPGEPIDLLNVAFDKKSSKACDAPDRITGLVALEELKRAAPDRKWNWVEISVSEEELNKKVDHIADLIHPLNSILDESLGCALWFAARGQGLLNGEDYKSPARVVLVGMGADELFGGYSRHAKALQQSGWPELEAMLLSEVQNIGARNLGRDNRVVSDHGRMMRAPYLAEDFVTYVNRLPSWVRCCPNKLPRGVGDKTLLRLVAYDIGLRDTAVQPKRALQFGSRIANSKQKGHQTSKKLTQPS